VLEKKTEERNYKNCYIRLLTRQDKELISCLITDKKDKVHPVETTLEGFAGSRVGTSHDNKQCWILIEPETNNLKAALYVYRDPSPVRGEYDLAGRVDHILSSPVSHLERRARSAIFYSVSSFDTGAGVHLIDGVANKFGKSSKIVLSTLSPLRNFATWAHDNGKLCQDIRSNPKALRSLALDFLMANKDKVQQFHLKNGAYIGDIKLEANCRGSKDDILGMNVMVNYVYPRKAVRLDNQLAYELGYLTASWYLVCNRKNNACFGQTRLKIGSTPRIMF